MSYLTDIGTFLSSLGYSPICYINANKSTPNCIIIAPYGGDPEKSCATGELSTRPHIQIMVVNSVKETAFETATSIHDLLRKIYNKRVGNTRFCQISPKSPPIYAGTNENSGLHYFSINFSILF